MLNRSQIALLLGATLSAATPALCQNAALDAATTSALTAPLQQALEAQNTPSSIPASALDAAWHRFKPNASLSTDLVALLNGQPRNAETGPLQFVTRGQTLQVGGETFLIAYRGQLDVAAMDDATRLSLQGTKEPLETGDGYARFLPTQTLKLCLLNIRQIGDMSDLRAFDSKTDIVKVEPISDAKREQLNAQAANERSVSNLKQIGLALIQYVQDYDEKLPPMRSAQSMAEVKPSMSWKWDDPRSTKVQQVLQPYIKNAEVFAHPTTHEIYRPNINVSRRTLSALEPASQVVTFYEASPASDGTRAVLYLDGHVKRELETDWARIRTLSDQIAPPFKPSMSYLVPKTKTAIGANSALQGAKIDVDGIGDSNTIALRGTAISAAQKTLAEFIARKNAPGVRIVNQLVVRAR